MNKVRITVETSFISIVEVDINRLQKESLEKVIQDSRMIDLDSKLSSEEDDVSDILCRHVNLDDWNKLKFKIINADFL